MEVKRFDSSEGNVWKYVFDFGDAIAEAVLYKYDTFYKRTVICCSTQSGCPVGCVFCGTGKQFIRNLNSEEITYQINHILKDMDIEDVNSQSEKFKIMFMSMGEPMLNIDNVCNSIKTLNSKYCNADLLISTVGIKDKIALEKLLSISKSINKVGLQFSIHKSRNEDRDFLIPYKNKLNLKEIRDVGVVWFKETGRKVYLNYCIDGSNNTELDFQVLCMLFSPVVYNLTFSVVCSSNENMKDIGYKNLEIINEFSNKFLNEGYDVRVFNPAGQDDIGGGCGQLWYVQEWIKKNKI